MWNLYDELGIGIPSGILVEGCVVGKYWTTVRANGNIGVARTLGDTSVDLKAAACSMLGQPLREVANHLRWDNLLLASIGVAAYNCYYNSASHVAKMSAPPAFEGELAGKKVAVIGELPNLEAGLKDSCSLTVLPLPECGALDGSYADALKGDFAFISGDALTNRTLPELLKLVGPDTKVSLVGVSVPAAPVLFAFDTPIHNLSGVYAVYDTTVEGAALHDIADLAPGVANFSVNPMQPRRVVDADALRRFQGSPYKAAAFNNSFNPWAGKEYDQSTWSPIFRG